MSVAASEDVEWKIWNFVLSAMEFQTHNEITFCKKVLELGNKLYDTALLSTSLFDHLEAANDMFWC